MANVAAGAREHLVVTGSRSREKAYLAAIETAVTQHPHLIHYRVLYGPPRHRMVEMPGPGSGHIDAGRENKHADTPGGQAILVVNPSTKSFLTSNASTPPRRRS
ncbi:hypothetical protein SALCHL_000016 [Streptomyces albus subsp. chlorinus]|uniref:hypothetical protein n=1 Tax=Streptomyces albus TaxID=1888 RepID=UPI001FAC05D3|nr:hypothetical protein [Streptomyces albus]